MHIFLTGPKRVGKSTLLNAMLQAFPGTPGGFRTVRLNSYLPGRFTVHLLPLNGDPVPREENLLFSCGDPSADTVSQFDRLGCEALQGSIGSDLLIMDELGPHETAAKAFQAAVRKALDGDVPILGVLQQADTAFLSEIASHPQVVILSVTQENRDFLMTQIPELVDMLKRKVVPYGP